MLLSEEAPFERQRRIANRPLAAAAAVAVLMAACAETPNWIDRYTLGATSPDDQEAVARPVPGADQPYPLLSSVPPRPTPTSRAEMQDSMKELTDDAATAAQVKKELEGDVSLRERESEEQEAPNGR